MQDIVYKLVPGLQEGKCCITLWCNHQEIQLITVKLSLCWTDAVCICSHTVRKKYLSIKYSCCRLLGVRKQVTVRTHTHHFTYTIGFQTRSDLEEKDTAKLLSFFCFSSHAAEIKKQREFYQKLGMEVPGDIKGELCNMKTHLDQRNGTLRLTLYEHT